MSNLPTFGAYAAAFEESLQDDDWTRLEQYFSEDASYRPGDGTEAIGREAVLQALQASVNQLERKCDSRDPVGEPELSESGDTITLKFTVKYTKEGLPDLMLSGYETVQFSDGRILKMEDVLDDASAMLEWTSKL
ncbi:MAG TPA: nuclear transport factor 2 family protein [Pseudomonadales bacterium]|jgi:ketosteroid isomerase-like protein